MGCVSSKIMRKSVSFREELNRSFKRRTNGLEEIIISKNGGDQFVALLCTANTVARRLKEVSPAQEPNDCKNSPLKHTNSNVIGTEEPKTDIETINTWELLAGLEEDKEVEEQQSGEGSSIPITPSRSFHNADEYKFSASHNSIGHSRSFRTIEDFDSMMEANRSLEGSKSSIKVKEDGIEREVEKLELKHESINREVSAEENGALERNVTSEKGSRRKAMAKELAALKVPAFEFSRTGSLREWLLLGGQVFSPGSYVTPKFGNLANNGDNTNIFDPELVAHFEQAMEQLTMEEECILKEIIGSLEGGNEEGISMIETTTDNIQGKDYTHTEDGL